ncbi:hypothetical protein JOD54_005692 [Actinokineospora baliensis]|nr:hypothetical protein [Actinokineospora baliensis]
MIGGKLGINGRIPDDQRMALLTAGFDHVFDHDEVPAFRALLTGLGTRVVS